MGASQDLELVRKWCSGHSEAGNKLIEENRGRLFKIVCTLANDFPDYIKEEIVDEAFYRAFRDIVKFSGNSSFLTWVYGYAIRCVKETRKKEREHLPLESITEEILWNYDDKYFGDPLHIIIKRETANAVVDALHALSDRHQMVIQLKSIEKLKFKEVAEHMGLTVDATVSLWRRAVNILRKGFENQ